MLMYMLTFYEHVNVYANILRAEFYQALMLLQFHNLPL